MRAHRQADVTDHQLHDEIYCGNDNGNQILMGQEKWIEWFNCKKNCNKTLECEEDGMQDHISRVYCYVGVALFQF